MKPIIIIETGMNNFAFEAYFILCWLPTLLFLLFTFLIFLIFLLLLLFYLFLYFFAACLRSLNLEIGLAFKAKSWFFRWSCSNCWNVGIISLKYVFCNDWLLFFKAFSFVRKNGLLISLWFVTCLLLYLLWSMNSLSLTLFCLLL